MRIAMISSEKLPVPPVRGGAIQVYIDAVAPRLARRHAVTVFGIPDAELPPEEIRDGVRHIRVPCTPNDANGYLTALTQRMSWENFDVIEVFNRPLFVLPLAKACPGSRIVLSLHNEMFRETKIPPELAKPTIEAVDAIVTVSEFIAESVRARYPEAAAKLRPLYSGVDVQRFVPKGSPEATAMAERLRRELGLPDGPVILFVGRLSPSKGAHVLLEAMPAVLARHPEATLVMVGSRWFGENDPNEYVRQIWQQADALGGRVVFTGHVGYDRIPDYFALGDLFVCPSQWAEPLARVLYEAMAAALPIITTARGGNPEVVHTGTNGIVIEAWNEPAAFAEAILHLLDHPDLAAEMGRQGRAIAEERFTWGRVAWDLERVLVAAAKTPGAAAVPGEIDLPALATPSDSENGLDASTLRKLRERTLRALELAGIRVKPKVRDDEPEEETRRDREVREAARDRDRDRRHRHEERGRGDERRDRERYVEETGHRRGERRQEEAVRRNQGSIAPGRRVWTERSGQRMERTPETGAAAPSRAVERVRNKKRGGQRKIHKATWI